MLEYVRRELKEESEEDNFYKKNGFETNENIIFMEGAAR